MLVSNVATVFRFNNFLNQRKNTQLLTKRNIEHHPIVYKNNASIEDNKQASSNKSCKDIRLIKV